MRFRAEQCRIDYDLNRIISTQSLIDDYHVCRLKPAMEMTGRRHPYVSFPMTSWRRAHGSELVYRIKNKGMKREPVIWNQISTLTY